MIISAAAQGQATIDLMPSRIPASTGGKLGFVMAVRFPDIALRAPAHWA
jgi:hypothetical protein